MVDNWRALQQASSEVLRAGLETLISQPERNAADVLDHSAGVYLVSLNGMPVYAGDAGVLASRIKQQFSPRSTFYKNYLRHSGSDLAPKYEISSFKVRCLPTKIGRKELEEFAIAEFGLMLNKAMGRLDGPVEAGKSTSELWAEFQSAAPRLLSDGSSQFLRGVRVAWNDYEPPRAPGMYRGGGGLPGLAGGALHHRADGRGEWRRDHVGAQGGSGLTSELPRIAATTVLAAVGTAVFVWIGLPLPFLFGPLIACLIAALAGAPVAKPGKIGVLMRTVLGVAIGASITPELVERLPQMTVSLALVPVYVIVVALVGVPFFRRVYGLDRPTAFFAAMPGGLQEMTAFGEETGAKVRTLTLIHGTRLLVIVLIAPVIMVVFFGANLDAPVGAPAADIPPHELVIMCITALVGWQVALRLRIFGAVIIGPMILAAALSLSDVIHYRPPPRRFWPRSSSSAWGSGRATWA